MVMRFGISAVVVAVSSVVAAAVVTVSAGRVAVLAVVVHEIDRCPPRRHGLLHFLCVLCGEECSVTADGSFRRVVWRRFAEQKNQNPLCVCYFFAHVEVTSRVKPFALAPATLLLRGLGSMLRTHIQFYSNC